MPKGSELYAPWCQALLRAARAGRVLKRKEPSTVDNDKVTDGNEEHAVSDGSKNGFVAQRWVPIPRRLEEPEHEYLAKRRKGLSSTRANGASGVQIVGPGGEVIMADGVALVEEPVRRRMPPPRRKPKKGPGRRKKLPLPEGSGASAAAGASDAAQAGALPGLSSHGDSAMPQALDGGVDHADEEDEEEGEEGEEEDEGEEGEDVDADPEAEGDAGGEQDDDREEGEIKDEEGTMLPIKGGPNKESSGPTGELCRSASSSPGLPLAAIRRDHIPPETERRSIDVDTDVVSILEQNHHTEGRASSESKEEGEIM